VKENGVSGMPSACLYVGMSVYLASAGRAGQILFIFIFGMYEFIHHRSVQGECEHFSSKNTDPSDESQKSKWRFSQK
jgi:hypothetical protein